MFDALHASEAPEDSAKIGATISRNSSLCKRGFNKLTTADILASKAAEMQPVAARRYTEAQRFVYL
jgi:hypothetical protein